MKKIFFKNLALVLIALFALSSIASAATVLFPTGGGTGTSTIPILGQVLVGQSNGTYAPQATSTLGISGGGGSGGITSLNGLTGATQTFATSSNDSIFSIISSGNTHTFNFPNNLVSYDYGSSTYALTSSLPVPGGSATNIQYNDSGVFGGLLNSAIDAVHGLLGINEATPIASVHAGVGPTLTIGAPSGSVAGIQTVGVPGGFSFGSGNKTYNVWSQRTLGASTFYSASNDTTNFIEPSSSNYDPQSPSANINYAESGYTATGNNFVYQVWALYPGSQISLGTAQSGNAFDDSSSNPYAVDVSWVAPTGPTPSLLGYLVQVTGSNPNTNLYQVVSGTSFVDNNTGWTSSASYTPILYSVNVFWTGATGATDYLIANTATPSYGLSGGPTVVVDNNTNFTGGTPTVTPTSYTYASLISEGTTELTHSGGALDFFGATPIGQQNGDIGAALTNYGLITSPFLLANSLEYSGGQLTFASNNLVDTSGNVLINTSTGAITSESTFTAPNSTGIDTNGYGTLNRLVLTGSAASGLTNGTLFYNSGTNRLNFNTTTAGNQIVATFQDIPWVLNNGGTGLSGGYTQGDMLYYTSGTALSKLAKNASSTRYISNTGSSNAPAWSQINLTNGVTGSLPSANGGTGTSTAFTAGSVIFATSTGVYSQDNSGFFWNAFNHSLGIGTTTPSQALTVAGNEFLTGNLGIASSTPSVALVVASSTAPSKFLSYDPNGSTATSTVVVGSSGIPGQMVLRDTNGSTCTSLTTLSGVLTAQAITCP